MGNNSCLICHVLFASISSFTVDTPFLTKCCNRWICDNCLEQIPKLYTYCPFCHRVAVTNRENDKISTADVNATNTDDDSLPTYEEVIYSDLNKFNNILKLNSFNDGKLNEKLNEKGNYGVVHYVKKDDTLIGLAFKYGIEVNTI
jgi:hypothetical protein